MYVLFSSENEVFEVPCLTEMTDMVVMLRSGVPRTELYCANTVTAFQAVGFALISLCALRLTGIRQAVICTLHHSIYSSSYTEKRYAMRYVSFTTICMY